MLRLNLYQRYLIRETFAAVFLVLAAFLALFAFFNFIDELRSVGKAGYTVFLSCKVWQYFGKHIFKSQRCFYAVCPRIPSRY